MNLARIKLHNYKAAHKIDIPVAYLSMRLNTGPIHSYSVQCYRVWAMQPEETS